MDSKFETLQTDFMRCFLCSNFYEDPKTLPCLHSFCKKCLIKHIEQLTTEKTRKCPVCRKHLDVDTQKYQKNAYFQNRVLFAKEQEKKLTNPMCAVCKIKSEKNIQAVAQCISCLDLLCKVCSDIHTLTTLTINHQVFPVTEIKTGKYDDDMFRVRFKPLCPKHSNEELKFFCRSCHVLTCFDCVLLEHRGHEFKSSEDLKQQKVNAAKKKCEKLKEKVITLNQSRDLLISKKDQLDTLKTTVKNNIKKKCAETVSKIDKGKSKILKEIDDFLLPKSEVLESGINRMSAQCEAIGEALRYVEFFLKGTNADIIFQGDELQNALENLTKDDDDVNDNKDETSYACTCVETPDIALKIGELKMELILGKTNPSSAEPSPVDDNSSDFLSVSDKAIQREDEYFGMFDKKRVPKKENIKSIS